MRLVYHATETGREPVREYINAIHDVRERGALFELLEELASAGRAAGVTLRHLRDRLWEIRLRAGQRDHRILYVRSGPETFVLLHAFVKTTGRTPRRHIELAMRRARDVPGR